MPEQKYGKRMCLQCGQTFEATHPAHITCSAQCASERRHMQRRQSAALARSRRKKRLLDLLASLDEAWADVEWINCRYEARRKELEALLMATCAAHALEMKKLEDQLAEARKELAAVQNAVGDAQTQPDAEIGEKRPPAAPVAPVPAEKTGAAGAEKPKDIAPPPVMQECTRMRLRATTLPCGERGECEGCERLRPLVLEPGDKLCAKCKRPFTPKAPAQKYCSKQCQEDAARAKLWKK